MPGDPLPRSAHRAYPPGGLALLTPQALVRQAQAGQARARQVIIRQALARQTRGAPPAQRSARAISGTRRSDGRPPSGAPGRGLQTSGLRAVVRLAAEVQAAQCREAEIQSGDRAGATSPHRQFRAAPWRAVRQPQQTLQSLLRGLAAVIVLAIVGLSVFFVVVEERRGTGRESAAARPGAEPAIASRAVDGTPLTLDEVFPGSEIKLLPGAAGYRVALTHSDSDCGLATKGDLGALLREHGCDQVVRARLTAPYGGYQVTTGIFNLVDDRGAARADELTGGLVESGRGTFTTLGGSAGDPLIEPLAQVGWHSRGHFLLYSVVARPDGQLVTDDDPYAARITAELVQQYLGGQVLGKRTLDP